MQVFAEHNCNLILFKGCSIGSLGIRNSRACVSNIIMSDSVIKHLDNGMFVINCKCVGPKSSSCQILAQYIESFLSFLNLPPAFRGSIPCFRYILSPPHSWVGPTNCECEEIYTRNMVYFSSFITVWKLFLLLCVGPNLCKLWTLPICDKVEL